MKTLQITILLAVIFCSCTYMPFPKERYEIGESFRNLITPYNVGDTLIFRSSQNIIDSFIISGIDTTINDRNGYFINKVNGKSISIRYKQIPVDKWQYRWSEGRSDGKEYLHSEDGTFISLSKDPKDETTEYYFDFKNFRCSRSKVPELHRDTIKLNGLEITDYYIIDDCAVRSLVANSINRCYSTINKGLVAFTTYNDIIWTRLK